MTEILVAFLTKLPILGLMIPHSPVDEQLR
jgi:hypothetical protein